MTSRWQWGIWVVAVAVLMIVSCASLEEEQIFVTVEPTVANPRPAAVIVQPTARPRMERRTESWVTLPELPPDATQADYGREIYRLVCSTCHGDRGQGLTDEWRATLAPENQNCWQSKCHNSTYPVEGFELPRHVPPVAGAHITAKYRTAADLYAFIQANMPYQARGTLLEEEYWQLTAFLLELNGLETEGLVLDEESAALVNLRGS